jgi:hypothetical protein
MDLRHCIAVSVIVDQIEGCSTFFMLLYLCLSKCLKLQFTITAFQLSIVHFCRL